MQLHEYPVGIALRAELTGLGASHRGFQGLGHIADAEAEIGDFVAIDTNFLLWCPGFAADIDVRDAGHVGNCLNHAVGQRVERIEVKTADFHRQSFVAAQNPSQQKLALWGARLDIHAGDLAGQPLPQICRNVDVGPRALACRHERHANLTFRCGIRVATRGADTRY